VNALQLRPAPGDWGVSQAPQAIEERDKLVSEARKVTAITDDFDLEIATVAARELKGLLRETEKTRKLVKEPVLDLCRQIDFTAGDFMKPAQDELTRIERFLTTYATAQYRAAAEAEAKRQAEIDRIEADRSQAEQAGQQAERARKQADKAAQQAAEREMLGERVRKAEQARIEAAKAAAAVQAEAAKASQERLAKEAQAVASGPVVTPYRAAGMSTRKVPQFEVLDIWKVPREMVRIEPNREAILDAIRKGVRDIPGLRCWMETTTIVR